MATPKRLYVQHPGIDLPPQATDDPARCPALIARLGVGEQVLIPADGDVLEF